jgi:uncharacterized protein YdhG (YjbR/CyaY superfamily)
MKALPVTSVEDYIATRPAAQQRILKRVRTTIRKAVPDAVEVISYNMPAYKLHGRVLLYFAGWKDHYALYPGGADALSVLKDDLAAYKVSKGTIRFENAGPVPVALIERIAKVRAAELAGLRPAKTSRAARR